MEVLIQLSDILVAVVVLVPYIFISQTPHGSGTSILQQKSGSLFCSYLTNQIRVKEKSETLSLIGHFTIFPCCIMCESNDKHKDSWLVTVFSGLLNSSLTMHMIFFTWSGIKKSHTISDYEKYKKTRQIKFVLWDAL